MEEQPKADGLENAKAAAVQFYIDQQCPVQYVTIYNDRAEVTRAVRHHFDAKGNYDLIFADFSPSVDLTSLHVSGSTDKACTILEVSHQTRYDENTASDMDSTPLDQLQNQLEHAQAEIEKHQRELTRIVKQRTWLDGRAAKLMNQDGQLTTSDLDSMQQFIDFYYKQLSKLDDEATLEEHQIQELTQQRDGLTTKMNEHGAEGQSSRRKARREATVTVHIASEQVDIAMEISYLISNCSWSASYDVRVNNSTEVAGQQTQLTYYASIMNKSQENWANVQLSLSTAMPSLGGALPKLTTLKIGFEKPRYNHRGVSLVLEEAECLNAVTQCSKKSSPFRKMRARTSVSASAVSDSDDGEVSSSSINVLATHTEASMSSSSFSIPRRATIDADGKPHKVTIAVLDLTSTFTYTVVPKLSVHAFLKASTINTSDKQLLAGPASVFMDNNFVTHASIDNVCPGDTFDLPLGTDPSMKVVCRPVKKVSDTQGLLSKVHHESVRRETRIVNTKQTTVTIFVYEQVPLSSNEKIKVKLLLPDLRSKDQSRQFTVTMNDANNLEWKCVLQPRGECVFPLEYTVEWPQESRIEYTDAC